jgi:hypothetical protein
VAVVDLVVAELDVVAVVKLTLGGRSSRWRCWSPIAVVGRPPRQGLRAAGVRSWSGDFATNPPRLVGERLAVAVTSPSCLRSRWSAPSCWTSARVAHVAQEHDTRAVSGSQYGVAELEVVADAAAVTSPSCCRADARLVGERLSWR